MNNAPDTLSKIFILLGGLLLVVGLILWLSKGRLGFGWFGNLPGDIKFQRENFSFYAPIVSMLLVSIVISLLLRVFRQFF